jgi:hypothetical protein
MENQPLCILVLFLAIACACQPIATEDSPITTSEESTETYPPNTPLPTSSVNLSVLNSATELAILPTSAAPTSRLVKVTEFIFSNFISRESLEEWENDQSTFEIDIRIKTIDLDGKGESEIVAAIEVFPPSGEYHESGIWVLSESDNNYNIELGLFRGYYMWFPRIFTAEDFTGDGLPDVMVQSTFGGSGCDEYFAVISVVDGNIENIFEDFVLWSCKSYGSIRSNDLGDEHWIEIFGDPLSLDPYPYDEVFDGVRFYFSPQAPYVEYELFSD